MSENKTKTSIWEKFPLLQKIKNIKHIELILLAIFCIVLIVVYTSTTKNTSNNATSTSTDQTCEQYNRYLEDKLSNILSNISGAGSVKVMITLDGGMRYEYAKESEEVTTSNEIGSNTTTKTTKTEEVVLVTINGKTSPLIIKESYPDVCGVLVVASGASNAQVKLNIMRAIVTLLSVKEDCIQVMVGG